MTKKTLVLGASENPTRYSNIAIKRLLSKGIDVVTIGNKSGLVEGVVIYKEKINFLGIDTITLYLGAKIQKEYYEYILSLNPNRVLFNPGTENEELENLLTENNIYFERACMLVLLSIGEY